MRLWVTSILACGFLVACETGAQRDQRILAATPLSEIPDLLRDDLSQNERSAIVTKCYAAAVAKGADQQGAASACSCVPDMALKYFRRSELVSADARWVPVIAAKCIAGGGHLGGMTSSGQPSALGMPRY